MSKCSLKKKHFPFSHHSTMSLHQIFNKKTMVWGRYCTKIGHNLFQTTMRRLYGSNATILIGSIMKLWNSTQVPTERRWSSLIKTNSSMVNFLFGCLHLRHCWRRTRYSIAHWSQNCWNSNFWNISHSHMS